MVKRGLPDEVRGLLNAGYAEDLPAMRGLGYKEMLPYIKGAYGLETAIDLIQTGTRRYAKRQETWFRHRAEGIWIDEKDTLKRIGERIQW
jgi:tRNA dimethylallyltransferase